MQKILTLGFIFSIPLAMATGEGVRVYNRDARVWSAATTLQGTLNFSSGISSAFITKFGRTERQDKTYNLINGKIFKIALAAAENQVAHAASAKASIRTQNERGRAISIVTGVARNNSDLSGKILRLAFDPPRADPLTQTGDTFTIAGADFGNPTTGAGALDTDLKATVTNFYDEEISNVEVPLACARKVEYAGLFFTPQGFKTCTLYQGQRKKVRDVKRFYDIALRVGLYNGNVNQNDQVAFAYFDTSYKTVVKNRETTEDCKGTGTYTLVCGSVTYNNYKL